MAHGETAAAYRLNWNPDHPDTADDLSEKDVETCQEQGYVELDWRCGNARIRAGQRILVLRTGKGARGIIGSGVALGEPQGGDTDEVGDYVSRWVRLKLDLLSLEPVVDREALSVPPLDGVKWSSQAAAARLTQEQLDAVDGLILASRGPRQSRRPEELDPSSRYAEGAVREITINAYERSQAGRSDCIKAWGTACAVCDLDFGKRFGSVFEGLIHVHHLVPLSSVKNGYILDPRNDLRPVCPNCHAMLHRNDPPFSIEEGRKWFAT